MIQHNQVGGISKLKELFFFFFFNTTIKNNRLNKDIKDTFKKLVDGWFKLLGNSRHQPVLTAVPCRERYFQLNTSHHPAGHLGWSWEPNISEETIHTPTTDCLDCRCPVVTSAVTWPNRKTEEFLSSGHQGPQNTLSNTVTLARLHTLFVSATPYDGYYCFSWKEQPCPDICILTQFS